MPPIVLFLLVAVAACVVVLALLRRATRRRVPDHVPVEWTRAWLEGASLGGVDVPRVRR